MRCSDEVSRIKKTIAKAERKLRVQMTGVLALVHDLRRRLMRFNIRSRTAESITIAHIYSLAVRSVA